MNERVTSSARSRATESSAARSAMAALLVRLMRELEPAAEDREIAAPADVARGLDGRASGQVVRRERLQRRDPRGGLGGPEGVDLLRGNLVHALALDARHEPVARRVAGELHAIARQ